MLNLLLVTQLNQSLRYSTKRNSQGLFDFILELERAYRRRLNRLTLSSLLTRLGEEAISDIPSLFNNSLVDNNLPTPMEDLYKPRDFSSIQGYPHAIPDKALEKLPSFQGNNAISVKTHLRNFNACIAK